MGHLTHLTHVPLISLNMAFGIHFLKTYCFVLYMQPPKFEFYDPKTPFYTSPRFLPPTKVDRCRVWLQALVYIVIIIWLSYLMANWLLQIVDAIISHGCFLRECSVQHSIVGVRSRLESGVELEVIQHLLFPIEKYLTRALKYLFLMINCILGHSFWSDTFLQSLWPITNWSI